MIRIPTRLSLGHFLALIPAVLLVVSVRANEDWPQFRGPNGDGHADSRGLPLTWSESENVTWKTPVHGRAWSSPVVLVDQVWLTTATEDGHQLFVVCVDRASGRIVRDQKIFDVEKPQFRHEFNSYASPTPVLEPGSVYVTFGSPGTACVDSRTGQVRWERRDLVCNHYRGAGSSPILLGDLLIMNFDGSDRQFVIALDKRTGKTAWETKRSIDFQDLDADGKPASEGDWRKAFATPHVAAWGGDSVLISQGAKATYAYEPLTGKEIWRVEERTSHSAGTRPLVGFGMVFVPTGWSQGQILAIKPGKRGEVLDANADTGDVRDRQLQVAWKTKRNAPKKPSLLLEGELLIGIDDGGVASCLEAKTGTEVWRERVGGNYSASPVSAEGRVYLFSEEGKTTVIEAGRQFKVVAENKLDGGFMASPAVAGQAFFLRTKTHLYRVEQ